MNTLEQILVWLDAVPARNFTLAYVCFAATLFLAIWPLRRAKSASTWDSGWLFALAVLATLCAFRWPIWFVNYELNPDESQMVAGARTLLDYPVFWKHVDGTTHGPLTDYFLVALAWCGLPVNYVTARFGATLLLAAALLGVWSFVRRMAPEGLARLAIFPGFAFWSLVSWPEFTHYSSEVLSVALIGVALGCLGKTLFAHQLDRPAVAFFGALGGFLLGCVPFGKPQLTLIALTVGLGSVVALFCRRGEQGSRRVLSVVVGGALLPSLIAAVFLGIFGLYGQFHASYLLNNIGYVDSRPAGLLDMMSDFFALISHGQSYAWFIVPTALYACWQTQVAFASAAPRTRFAIVTAWLALGVALYSVVIPGRMFAHYLHLLVLPATVLAGMHFALVAEKAAGWKATTLAIAVFLGVTVAPQVLRQATALNIFVGKYAQFRTAPLLPESAYLRDHARPDDRLAIWGWKSQVWVETGMPQGTREAHTEYQIKAGPMQHFYRVRYLNDLTKRRPEWFVDVVGVDAFAYTNRAVEGHECFPALASFVSANYEFVGEFGSARVYRRK